MRERWSFGRSVGGWASGFVAMCGSRLLQFCILKPSLFCTAVVVQGGCGLIGSWLFFFSCFFLPLYRPRAGIIQRTTINSTSMQVIQQQHVRTTYWYFFYDYDKG